MSEVDPAVNGVATRERRTSDEDRTRPGASDNPRHHGLRTVQNWIGGSGWTPIGAAFVPPGAERVEALMSDLVDYLNGSAHSR